MTPDRHGPYVPDVPEVKTDESYRQCQRFALCGRRDGHDGPCLPCPKALASIRSLRTGHIRHVPIGREPSSPDRYER